MSQSECVLSFSLKHQNQICFSIFNLQSQAGHIVEEEIPFDLLEVILFLLLPLVILNFLISRAPLMLLSHCELYTLRI